MRNSNSSPHRKMATMPTAAPFPAKLRGSFTPSSTPVRSTTLVHMKPLQCTPPLQQQLPEVDATILCEPCNGKGWLLCDFCKGQKTNVKAADNKRIYRRCPNCRAVGYVLCSRCKVFKCVTFPDFDDSTEE